MLKSKSLPIRTSGPSSDAETSVQLIGAIFAKLVVAVRARSASPYRTLPVNAGSVPQHLRFAEQDVQIIGLTHLLAAMVATPDPRLLCGGANLIPADAEMTSMTVLDDMVEEWLDKFPPFATRENTDEVWSLFHRAVIAGELSHKGQPDKYDEVQQLVAELEKLAPDTNRDTSWTLRVWSFVDVIVPEYRLWFAHLVPDVTTIPLPRL